MRSDAAPKIAMTKLRLTVLVLACLGATGCRHAGRDYIWIDNVPNAMLSTDAGVYRIEAGDVIGIRVWHQEANSVERAKVREDGKVSMPFLNDVAVSGMEPNELARRLEAKLKQYINSPTVTVVVHERRPLRVSVLGKAVRPGVYDLDHGAGVLNVLAAAGGLTPFADEDGIYLLRSGYWADGHGEPGRIRFRYADLRAGRAKASLFRVQPGDVVVVE